jgi:integrase
VYRTVCNDIFVAHVVLKGSGIMPIVGQLVSSGVPEYVRVDREWKPCRFPGADYRFQESWQDAARKRSRYAHRDATMILVACRHGLRASEVCGLQWDQIDLNSGRLHVRRAKGGIDNVHPLSGKEIRALRQLRRENTESRYVFVTERGGPATTGSRSISFSVRYSLGRSSELGALLGTVRFTMVERAGFRADFAM